MSKWTMNQRRPWTGEQIKFIALREVLEDMLVNGGLDQEKRRCREKSGQEKSSPRKRTSQICWLWWGGDVRGRGSWDEKIGGNRAEVTTTRRRQGPPHPLVIPKCERERERGQVRSRQLILLSCSFGGGKEWRWEISGPPPWLLIEIKFSQPLLNLFFFF